MEEQEQVSVEAPAAAQVPSDVEGLAAVLGTRSRSVKERVGLVTSTAMRKTITVSVTRLVEHRLYKKATKRTKKFKAHDEDQQGQVGDLVRIRETRPLSKTKRWRLVEIVKRAD